MRRRGLLVLIGISVVLVVAAMVLRGIGISARREPTAIELAGARAAWRFLIPAAARDRVNPVAVSADALHNGLAHWANHCAICHGNDGGAATPMGRRLFPRPPDMRAARTQSLTDGELFYAIEQGVPLSGMPAWGDGTPGGEKLSWELVHFVRHLPKVSADELKEMDGLNPRAPEDPARTKTIDDFLSGGKNGRGGW